LREDDSGITGPGDHIVPTAEMFTRISFEGDAIGTIQNECETCETMEDV